MIRDKIGGAKGAPGEGYDLQEHRHYRKRRPGASEGFLLLIRKLGLYTPLPNSKAFTRRYGTHRVHVDLHVKDRATLFELFEEGKIGPIIAATFPLMGARAANKLLESGQVVGNVVLLDSELL